MSITRGIKINIGENYIILDLFMMIEGTWREL